MDSNLELAHLCLNFLSAYLERDEKKMQEALSALNVYFVGSPLDDDEWPDEYTP